MSLGNRPVEEKDILTICGFPQDEDELFFLFPKASFPLSPSQLQEAIESRSDSTVVEFNGRVSASSGQAKSWRFSSAAHVRRYVEKGINLWHN